MRPLRTKDVPLRSGRSGHSRIAPCLLLTLATGAVAACGGSGQGQATERLWVSAVPTNPKARTTAFLTTRTSDGKYIGAFFQGSLYRGGHDVFQWNTKGKDKATLTFLQDGNTAQLQLETCKPSRGFDYCLLVHGDPTGATKYQSRKRWAVRRPGKKEAAISELMVTFGQLAEDDEDLAAAFLSAGD